MGFGGAWSGCRACWRNPDAGGTRRMSGRMCEAVCSLRQSSFHPDGVLKTRGLVVSLVPQERLVTLKTPSKMPS